LPEKAGRARNPSGWWLWEFLAYREFCSDPANQHLCCSLPAALHLCCPAHFHQILAGRVNDIFRCEVQQFDRIQVNINARTAEFSTDEVVRIYRVLRQWGARLILQRHSGTQAAIDEFLATSVTQAELASGDVSVLLDASRGTGLAPASWASPVTCADGFVHTGYAGGISPENIESVLDATETAVRASATPGAAYWLDMESGVRTNNQFDLAKVERVLDAVARRRSAP